MSDSLQRQWVMLSLLPREPRRVDAATLEAQLRSHGLEINRRSIQRDLVALSALFPIVCDERTKPYQWSWAKDGPSLEPPGMSPHTALAFKLLAEALGGALPRATLAFVRSHLKSADRVLDGADGLAGWPHKVRIVEGALAPVPRGVRQSVLDVAMDALMHERRFLIVRNGPRKRTTKAVDPLGLLFRAAAPFLVCSIDDGPITELDLRQVKSVRATDMARVAPPRFDLDAYVRRTSKKKR
jgi:predicted DNA-binding transcriptional regulator YafY